MPRFHPLCMCLALGLLATAAGDRTRPQAQPVGAGLAVSLVVAAPSVVGPPSVVAVPKPPPSPYQVGMATWYGKWFQGKETTSGERFNMFAMTAAHKHLPFGTRVRVTNLLNHRSVVLRINDRGPVPQGRVIDLTYAAARVLHFYEDGLIPVRIDLLPKLPKPALSAAALLPRLHR